MFYLFITTQFKTKTTVFAHMAKKSKHFYMSAWGLDVYINKEFFKHIIHNLDDYGLQRLLLLSL